MSTYTESPEPITIVRGIADSLPLTWQAPDGTPINVTGFTFAASLNSRDVHQPLVTTVTDVAQGDWKVDWAEADVIALPIGRVSVLRLTVTDTVGNPHRFDIPVNGVLGS